jgi:hypothetical protein
VTTAPLIDRVGISLSVFFQQDSVKPTRKSAHASPTSVLDMEVG